MPLDTTDHPLFDHALEHAVKLTPPNLPPDKTFTLGEVQALMAMMWVHGMNWGVLNPQAAVSATMNFGERRKQELAEQSPTPEVPPG